MALKTWQPISDISVNAGVSPSTGTDHFAVIDDTSDADFLSTNSNGAFYEVFGHTNDPVPGGATSISVKVYYRGSVFGIGANFSGGIKVGATNYVDTSRNDASPTSYNKTWATNPATSSAWTATEVNAINLVGYLAEAGFLNPAFLYYLYAEITYTNYAGQVNIITI